MKNSPEKFFGLAGGTGPELFVIPFKRQPKIRATTIYLETRIREGGPREVYIPHLIPIPEDPLVGARILTRITTGLTEDDGVRLSDISDGSSGSPYVYAAELNSPPTGAAIHHRGLRTATLTQTLRLTANNNGGMNPEQQAKTHAALTRLRTRISGQ